MIKMIAAACRRPGMTHSEYEAYIYRIHAKIAREVPGTLEKYVQNHVFDSAFGVKDEPNYAGPGFRDSVTELYFASMQNMIANFQTEHVQQKVGPDGINFSDLSLPLSLIAREVEQPVMSAGFPGAHAKVMHFIRAAEGLELSEFESRLAYAHKTAMAENASAGASIRRCVHNIQLTEANDMLKYFGDQALPIFEAVASLWFDNEQSIGVFRSYENTMLTINADPRTKFYEPAHSFFLYAHERLIIGEFE